MNADNYSFIVFKGLQKPLEFMGLRGRFMVMAAAGFGVSFVGFCIGALCFSQLTGLGIMAVSAGASLAWVYMKQKNGLYDKKRNKDILMYKNIFRSK